ncbi:MAG: hypothetical protein ACKPFF_26130 [Planktothrix sp.]
MIKALDITIKYGDIEEVFTIYTKKLEVNLLELVHQSYLPSSSLPIKVFMGSEYITDTVEGKLRGTIYGIRQELKDKVSSMTQSREVLSLLDEAIETAAQWFGN